MWWRLRGTAGARWTTLCARCRAACPPGCTGVWWLAGAAAGGGVEGRQGRHCWGVADGGGWRLGCTGTAAAAMVAAWQRILPVLAPSSPQPLLLLTSIHVFWGLQAGAGGRGAGAVRGGGGVGRRLWRARPPQPGGLLGRGAGGRGGTCVAGRECGRLCHLRSAGTPCCLTVLRCRPWQGVEVEVRLAASWPAGSDTVQVCGGGRWPALAAAAMRLAEAGCCM